MRKILLTGFATLIFISVSANARSSDRNIGSWIVSHMVDNMDDSIKDVIISPDTDDRYAIVLRCFSNEPEAYVFVGKGGDKFEDKEGYKVMFRSDQTKPIEMAGTAQSNGSIALSQPLDVIRGTLNGSKLAFRFAGANESFSSDIVFRTVRNRDALADIVKDCSITP